MRFHCFIFFLLSVISSVFSMSFEEYKKGLGEVIYTRQFEAYFRDFEEAYVKQCKALVEEEAKERGEVLYRLNSQLRFNRLLERYKIQNFGPMVIFLLSDEKVWTEFVNLVHDDDDFMEVLAHLDDMRLADEENFKKFFKLAVAIAVVWDRERPSVHGQIGVMALEHENTALDVYKYFKALYGSSRAKIRLKDLSARDLVFVVDTPVPISELEWAKKKVKGKSKTWGKNYAKIKYDHPRLVTGDFVWPVKNGAYTLENIKKKGGICVDQAYYTVLTGRANGIPAMYFEGSGRRGGHAWAGVYLDENDWNTEVGRYAQDNYAVGQTSDPQIDQKISDHDLMLTYYKKFFRSSYLNMKPVVKTVQNLFDLKQKNLAFKYATVVKKKAPLYEEPWLIMEDLYKSKKRSEDLELLYKEKLKKFRDFPDVFTRTEKVYSLWLVDQDRQGAAEKLLKRSFKRGKNDRIDLIWDNAKTYSEVFENAKDIASAQKILEKFIKSNHKEMSNIFPALYSYHQFAERNKLEKDAKSFVKVVYGKMIRMADHLNREELMTIAISFYKLAKDERGEKRIQKDLDKYLEKKAKQARAANR